MPLDPLAANMQLEEQQTIAKVTKTTVDIWNYKGVGQLQTVKIFKDLRNEADRRENVRIRKNLWAVEIGGLWALSEKNGSGLPDKSVWILEGCAMRSMEWPLGPPYKSWTKPHMAGLNFES